MVIEHICWILKSKLLIRICEIHDEVSLCIKHCIELVVDTDI
jgi:hypothetical protein